MNKYQIIYADPPWSYEFSHTRARAITDYPTMDKTELCKLPIESIAEDNSLLFMWITFPKLNWAFDVMKSWGFQYTTNGFTWVKQNKTGNGLFWGMGYYTRSNAEICLIGKRGDGVPVVSHSIHSVAFEPISKHSRKPIEFKNRIVELFGDVNRIELFARKEDLLFDADGFDGWDVWGNEVESDINLLS